MVDLRVPGTYAFGWTWKGVAEECNDEEEEWERSLDSLEFSLATILLQFVSLPLEVFGG